ncbi:MAG: hypothetical protein GAK37_01028 [Pseudomonas sp.]|nr:MAG: hypothetical protein GAK37_01028 [Pseudomonas sp.]
MNSLAQSSTVEQQIVLHQFTPRHSVQARVMLGWSREDLAREASVTVDELQRFESLGEVEDSVCLSVAFCLEAQGLVFFPGFAPGWGMNVRTRPAASTENDAKGFVSRFLDSTIEATTPTRLQPKGA